jgi:hypothetical protein
MLRKCAVGGCFQVVFAVPMPCARICSTSVARTSEQIRFRARFRSRVHSRSKSLNLISQNAGILQVHELMCRHRWSRPCTTRARSKRAPICSSPNRITRSERVNVQAQMVAPMHDASLVEASTICLSPNKVTRSERVDVQAQMVAPMHDASSVEASTMCLSPNKVTRSERVDVQAQMVAPMHDASSVEASTLSGA